MLENKKYVLTVEGETEKIYFQWLRDKINECEERKYNVSFTIKVQQSPRDFYKGTNSKIVPKAIHVCDIESLDKVHVDKFKKILDEMKEAKKEKNIKYSLAYSNFSFELWIVLHKKACNKRLNHRKDYLAPINDCFNEKFEDLDHYKREKDFMRCLSKLTLDDVKKAIERAEKINSQNILNGYNEENYKGYKHFKENPSLSIHEQVKTILIECGVF